MWERHFIIYEKSLALCIYLIVFVYTFPNQFYSKRKISFLFYFNMLLVYNILYMPNQLIADKLAEIFFPASPNTVTRF